jgi:hypothetical protein
MSNEHTLELNRLVVGRDEAEYEADGTIGEYLAKRAAFYANRLGNGGKKVKEFDLVEDALSGGWVLMFYCERY